MTLDMDGWSVIIVDHCKAFPVDYHYGIVAVDPFIIHSLSSLIMLASFCNLIDNTLAEEPTINH